MSISRRMRWASHLAHIQGTEDANKILAGKKLKGRYFRIIKEHWVRRMLRGGLH
jgi:nuclear transport factor 2 (NTF2) superfamily protein